MVKKSGYQILKERLETERKERSELQSQMAQCRAKNREFIEKEKKSNAAHKHKLTIDQQTWYYTNDLSKLTAVLSEYGLSFKYTFLINGMPGE